MTGRALTPEAGARVCLNCSAWRLWDAITIANGAGQIVGRKPTGQCRAAPPAPNLDAITEGEAVWPIVSADDWCREFGPASYQHQPEPLPRPRRNNVA